MTTPPPIGSELPESPFDVAQLTAMANELFRALPTDEAPTGPVTPTEVAPTVRGGGGSLGSTPTPTGPVALSEVPKSAIDVPVVPGAAGYYFLSDGPVPHAAPGELDLLAAMPFTEPIPLLDRVPAPGGVDTGAVPTGLVDPPRDPGETPYYFLTERPTLSPNDARPVLPEEPASPSADPKLNGAPGLDVHAVRREFPILSERVNGKPLIWFDNGATTQKPKAVIDRLTYFYEHENSNILRSAHELARRADTAYEGARDSVARFLGAEADEIVFVRGTTEAINLVANTFGRKHLGPGDEVILSHLEHHANIVPWQLLAKEKGFTIKVIPVDERGDLLLGEYRQMLSERTKLVSVTQVSNALGTVTPAKEIIDAAHAYGAKVLIDGAQSVAHLPVDVKALGADFFVFSGHKIYGPTGIGALYGRKEVLADLPPWEGGGHMIKDVTFEHTEIQDPPTRFEAGTGNIADAVGLGTALDWLTHLGLPAVAAYEHELLHYATPRLEAVPGLSIIGKARDKAAVVSFVIDGIPPAEVGQWLNDDAGIAVRAGHHCAQPILRRFGHETTVRATFALYNTREEIDVLVESLRRLVATKRPVG